MADCCDCFEFRDESDSFESWQGLRGPYYTPHLSAEGVLSWTNTGNLPNPQPVDISGPPGSGVELRGPVASVADLPATAPSAELWLVGTASPYDGWFYNGASWEDLGQIAIGPAGPQGERGPQGPVGPQGPPVPLSDATPLMDGAATPGTGDRAARKDHRHPTDTSRVAKTGDTMTGELTVRSSNGAGGAGQIQVQGGDKTVYPASSYTYSANVRLADAYGNAFGLLRSCQDSTGKTGIVIYGLNQINTITNAIRLLFDGNTPVVELTAPDAWLSALSLGEPTATTVASEVFSSLTNIPISVSGVNFVRWGKVAQLRLQFTTNQAISVGTALITVKEALKPRIATAVSEVSGINTGFVSGVSGSISLNQALAQGDNRTLLATWIMF